MSQTLDQLETSAVQPSSAEPTIDEFAYKSIPPLAPVSALLGICALSGLLSPLGVVFAIFGAVLGFVALHQIDRSEGNLSGRKLAIIGTLTSAVLLVSGVALHVYWFQTEVPPGYQRISFGLDISKKGFVMEDGQGRVHPDIAALEGKSLFVKGYMYPGTQLEDLSTFLLCRDNGDCCFGGTDGRAKPKASISTIIAIDEVNNADDKTQTGNRRGNPDRGVPATDGPHSRRTGRRNGRATQACQRTLQQSAISRPRSREYGKTPS